jgi:outer membrane immunogenic protein
MWRKFLLASASATMLVGTAFAADLAVPPPPPPVFTWTGFYIGGYGGGEVTHTSYNTLIGPPLTAFSHLTPADIAAVDAEGSRTLNKGGFALGAEAGYNWQVGMFVLGVETDIGGITSSTRNVSLGFINGTGSGPGTFFASTLAQRVNNALFGTVRGRLGITFDRILVYGTGGLAYTSGNYGFTYTDALFPAGGSAVSGNKVGYAVGGGLEYALTNNVSIKGEFLYSQFGKVTATGQIVNFFNPNSTNTFATSARVQEYTGRVGINYRFDWLAPAPVVAKY